LEADRVGLELTALAGYKPDALADFYEPDHEQPRQDWHLVTDLFGVTTKSSKRLREMEKTRGSFQPDVLKLRPQSAQEFHAWQSKVVVNSGTGRTESVPGLLAKKALDPPLQDEVHTLGFSYDGQYLLAQDEGQHLRSHRDPWNWKFRIEAPDAYPANFSLIQAHHVLRPKSSRRGMGC